MQWHLFYPPTFHSLQNGETDDDGRFGPFPLRDDQFLLVDKRGFRTCQVRRKGGSLYVLTTPPLFPGPENFNLTLWLFPQYEFDFKAARRVKEEHGCFTVELVPERQGE